MTIDTLFLYLQNILHHFKIIPISPSFIHATQRVDVFCDLWVHELHLIHKSCMYWRCKVINLVFCCST